METHNYTVAAVPSEVVVDLPQGLAGDPVGGNRVLPRQPSALGSSSSLQITMAVELQPSHRCRHWMPHPPLDAPSSATPRYCFSGAQPRRLHDPGMARHTVAWSFTQSLLSRSKECGLVEETISQRRRSAGVQINRKRFGAERK